MRVKIAPAHLPSSFPPLATPAPALFFEHGGLCSRRVCLIGFKREVTLCPLWRRRRCRNRPSTARRHQNAAKRSTYLSNIIDTVWSEFLCFVGFDWLLDLFLSSRGLIVSVCLLSPPLFHQRQTEEKRKRVKSQEKNNAHRGR